MIGVIAKITIKEGSNVMLETLASQLQDTIMQHQPEAIYCDWYKEGDSNRYVVLERWTSDEALKLHMQTDHMHTIAQEMRQHIVVEPERTVLKSI